jgi:hypothetical protein
MHRCGSHVLASVAAYVVALCCVPAGAQALPEGARLQAGAPDAYRLMLSPYTYHYSQNPEHKHVWLVGVERERANGDLAGVAVFNNSFGQTSAFVYPWGGVYRHVLGQEQLFVKWSAGLLYGYRKPYEDKVPLNHHGFAPAILPTLGWEFAGKQQAQVVLLGNSALMFQVTVPIK